MGYISTFPHFQIYSQDLILDIRVMVQITTYTVLLVFSFTFQLLHQAKGKNTDSTQSRD